MPNFRKPFRGGLRFAPKNVKMVAVASGSTNWDAGTIVVQTGEVPSTQYYGGQSGYDERLMPEGDILSAADVASSGVLLGSGATDYKILGIATRKAIPQWNVWGSSLNIYDSQSGTTTLENQYIGTYVTDEPIWVCYSGTAPTMGGYVTLSSGTDGYVEACGAVGSATGPDRAYVIGQVIGISSGSLGPNLTSDTNIPVVLVDLSKKRGW